MKVLIEFSCDSESFDFDFEDELNYVLDGLFAKVTAQKARLPGCVCEHPEAEDTIRDRNGNTIGFVKFVED